MAKSLRSKSKRAFRAIKRDDPKSAYSIAEAARMQRLNSKLKASALKPKALTDAEEYKRAQEGYETESEDENEPKPGPSSTAAGEGMQVEGEAVDAAPVEKVKVSTSGPRLSHRETYKNSKGFQVRLPPKTHFRARGEKKQITGKPHRRR